MKTIVFSIFLILIFLPIYAQTDSDEEVQEEIKQRIAEQSFFNTTIMPGIIAAVVSGVIVAVIMFVREGVIEPKRWQKNIKVEFLKNQLEVYGTLETILDSCAKKALRQNKEASQQGEEDQSMSGATKNAHLLENPFDADSLQEIFQNSRYMLSKELVGEWLKFVREDEYFAVFDAKKKGSGLLTVDLKDMQQIVKEEFKKIKSDYEKITKIKI